MYQQQNLDFSGHSLSWTRAPVVEFDFGGQCVPDPRSWSWNRQPPIISFLHHLFTLIAPSLYQIDGIAEDV